MDSLGSMATSGLTVTLTPAQLFVGAGLLGVVLLSNAKSLLFMWHGRLFSQLARHLFLRRSAYTVNSAKQGGEALFAPVVTSSYTPLLDIDYNLHKSNSTFFNDLDDNRTELMLALFKDVVKPQRHGNETLKPKMFNLGGTSCIFKKAIAPFARYEISSRILCWDQKWIYVVSHFTKPGSNKPTHYLLGSSSKSRTSDKKVEDQQDRIYATAITKYVFKAGRVTCSPESILLECGLVPSPGAEAKDDSHWSWEQVQEECNKHLELARNFDSLAELHNTFTGKNSSALYAY